jgi:4-hydroxy-3-methylbut-2-enyl diphosphate reductase
MGPAAAKAAASRAAGIAAERVVIAGVCGALDPELSPGDLVVASELLGGDGDAPSLEDPDRVAEALRESGLGGVRVGPILTAEKLLTGAAREEARAGGAIAVDLESAWLAAAAAGRPLTVVRAVVDTPASELRPSIATARHGIRALRSVARAITVIHHLQKAPLTAKV